jgi:hypothetical protein
MKDSKYFIHTLNDRSFTVIKNTVKPGEIVFFYGEKPSSDFNLEGWRFTESGYLHADLSKDEYISSTISIATSVFDRLLQQEYFSGLYHYFKVKPEFINLSIKRLLIQKISNDCLILNISRKLSGDNSAVVFIENNKLLKGEHKDNEIFMPLAEKGSFLPLTKSVIYACLKMLKHCQISDPLCKKTFSLIFECQYDNYDNYEFLHWYSKCLVNRDDILYKVSSLESQAGQRLVHDKKEIFLRFPSPAGLYRKLKYMVSFLCLAFTLLLKFSNSFLALEIFNLKRFEVSYATLFDLLNARSYMRVRDELRWYHPLITGLLIKNKMKHLGYYHGGYTRDLYLSDLSFHYFAVFGDKNGYENYPNKMPDYMNIEKLGPFTMAESEQQKEPDTVTVFPTSHGKCCGTPESFLEEFYEACFYSLREKKMHITVKCKGNDQEEAAVKAGMKYSLNIQVDGGKDFDQERYENIFFNGFKRTGELIASSKLIYVMHRSTVAVEALSHGSRILIYMHEKVENPLEVDAPELIARSPEELKEKTEWILSLSDDAYYKYIKPIVGKWSVPHEEIKLDKFFEACGV